MTRDELYQVYDAAVPDDESLIMRYGSPENYQRLFLQQAEKNLSRRCRDLVGALIAWRLIRRYSNDTKITMLNRLQTALLQARFSAREAFDGISAGSLAASRSG
jgi:hypothetical protein